MKKASVKRAAALLLTGLLLLLTAFLAGRYGWRLFGFSACSWAGIDGVVVEAAQVRITGFYPGSFPQGFLGYHAEQVDDTLYVGFKFSGLFGIFETGDFDVTIPLEGEIRRVVLKTGDGGRQLWPEEGEQLPQETAPAEKGIYVTLERTDVYSVGWYFENKSGGMMNAAGDALETGRSIYLDNDVFYAAANLERPVPVMLTFSGKEGNTLARVNLRYDPQSPVMTITLKADGQILTDGIKVEEAAIPNDYEHILSQYRTALEASWSGQRLADAGLSIMIRDVPPETVGYAVEDLDGDGVSELAIGTLSGDEFYGKLIFVLYTLDSSGEAVQIFSGTERNRFYYAGGIRFAHLGASASDSSFVTTLKLEDGELVDMTYITDPDDYVQMMLTPFPEE